MGRTLSILAAVFALGLVFFLPEQDAVRLAALESHELFASPLGAGPAATSEDERPSLGTWLLNDVASDEEGVRVLSLGNVRAETETTAVHTDLRRSIVRALRQEAGDLGRELDLRGELEAVPGGTDFQLAVEGDRVRLTVDAPGPVTAEVQEDWKAPGPTSLLPPLVAIAVAVLLRRPLTALFLGVLVGAILRRHATESLLAASFGGALDVFRRYFWAEFANEGRAMIIAFVVFMLAMVGVMTRSGGIRGLMDRVSGMAENARRTQIAAYLMGLVVFFDDYANTILVGSTMRPLTDRFRIAREKLAYIVDSTAAPVAGLSIFSTWIAFEVSTFSAQLPAAGLSSAEGYEIFIRTIPYSFYCIFAILTVGIITLSGRDLGPMLQAERRSRSTGELLRPGATPMVSEEATAMEPAEGVQPRAWRAVLPLLAFLGTTLFEILRAGGAFGMGADFFTIEGATSVLYDGSGERPLFVGALAGFLVAALAALQAGLARDVVQASWTTLSSMGVAIAILYLAWMIGAVCKNDLGTGPYLTALVGDSIDPLALPTLLFLLAGLVAFATGSSWSTMSILLPLVVGLSFHLGTATELGPDPVTSGQHLLVMSIASVLSGAIFGDHCSPISDTTVMSSIASACDHIDHVKTQAPYAILTMLVSVACGYLPATYLGLSPWISLILGAGALVLVFFALGRKAAPDSV